MCWRARWSTATASGNKGKMTAGDVQWMTAGSGILHQEMPKGDPQGRMHGFQLWANLPASLKMTDPRYQDIPSQRDPRGDGRRRHARPRHLRRVLGQAGTGGRGRGGPELSRHLSPAGQKKRLKVETTRNAFAYVFAGSGTFRDSSDPQAVLTEQVAKPDAAPVYDANNHSLVLFDRGDEIVVQAGPEGIRFLLVSGKPLEEPVAWYGPIVMNTQDQLRQAMSELTRRHVHQAPLICSGTRGAEAPCKLKLALQSEIWERSIVHGGVNCLQEDVMRKALAIIGAAVFLVVGPGFVAGLVP